MRAMGIVSVLSWALLLGPSFASASELSAIEVLQPIDIENFIRLSRVTYTTYNGDDPGVLAVSMTCDSNAVIGEYGARNVNIAFSAGLKLRVVFNSDHEPPLFGDTLRVVLDARAATAVSDFADTTIAKATVQCVLVNAAQCKAARYVDVRVEGTKRFGRFGGVFGARRFRAGPLRRDYGDLM